MTYIRTLVQDFSTANPAYINATVTFWTVVDGEKTNVKATLYSAITGNGNLENPQTLDSYGKFRNPVYIDAPVIMEITGLGNTPDHDTGIVNPDGAGSGGSESDPTQFEPTSKYSPLKMEATDGWANGQPDTGTPATHNAANGDVPSFTTAKKKQICIVTTAGTLGGTTLFKGDILMALQDNPTLATHWAVITDCTTEFDAAIIAAQGAELELNGTFLINSTTLNAPINLVGDYTILNRCGYPAIYTAGNNTRASDNPTVKVAEAGSGVGTGLDVDDEIGSTLQQVSYFRLNTPAEISNFHLGQKVEIFTDAVHIAESGSSKGYMSNVITVTSLDLASGIVYGDRVIKYQNKLANATNIYLIPLHEDRSIKIRPGALFMGAPTIIGGQVGWWLTLDGSTPIAATISGSGSTRVLTFPTNLDWVLRQGIRIGLVAGTPEASCMISAISADGLQVTINVASTNDKGQAWSAPTSGTVYCVPAFWSTEFDTTTHGGCIVMQQAHLSNIDMELAKPWGAGVRVRFSHYNKIVVRPSKAVNIGTGINGKSWRLVYDVETYSSSMNNIFVDCLGVGGGGRHPYTTSSRTTSAAWTPSLWIQFGGCTCENRVYIKSKGDTGPAADTHAMTSGDVIVSDVTFPTTYNTAHTYRGVGAQGRSDDTTFIHKQVGGQIGLRIANGSDYQREAGSVDIVDLDVTDIPLRADSHGFHPSGSASNMPCGFLMMSQSSYTNKTLTTGKMKFKNAACGFNLENSCRASLKSVSHDCVGYALGWVQTAADIYIGECSADYNLGNGAEATSASTVTLGTGLKSFTIGTGLSKITAGMDVLVQDTAAPRTNYGWGRIVSYTSGTGALSVYIEGIRGSGIKSSWTITSGAKIPRFGIVMSGTAKVDIGVWHWKVGEGANPLEFFHSRDNTAGKVVNVGLIIVDDPLLKGLPSLVTAGREADFTIKVGAIIYNGQLILQDYSSTDPATPSFGVSLFSRFRAGRRALATKGPAGIIAEMQVKLGTKALQLWRAAGGGTTTLTALGIGAPTVTGTATAVSNTWATILGAFKRVQYVSAVGAASNAGAKSNVTVARGNAAGVGGFEATFRFSIESVLAGHALWVGLDSSSGSDIGDVNPSSLTNMCGFGADAADSNIQWMVNDGSGTATKVDLGASFPAKTNGAIYEGRIFCKPNDTVLYYSLERIDTAALIEGSSSSNLPVNTTGIAPGFHVGTRAETTTAATIGVASMYIESEL